MLNKKKKKNSAYWIRILHVCFSSLINPHLSLKELVKQRGMYSLSWKSASLVCTTCASDTLLRQWRGLEGKSIAFSSLAQVMMYQLIIFMLGLIWGSVSADSSRSIWLLHIYTRVSHEAVCSKEKVLQATDWQKARFSPARASFCRPQLTNFSSGQQHREGLMNTALIGVHTCFQASRDQPYQANQSLRLVSRRRCSGRPKRTQGLNAVQLSRCENGNHTRLGVKTAVRRPSWRRDLGTTTIAVCCICSGNTPRPWYYLHIILLLIFRPRP